MNKIECQYAEQLKLRKHAGEVEWYAYEAVKLRLANNTFYTPDFLVMLANGDLEVHEVKGRKGDGYYAQEDAKIKIKVAAAMYPFLFRIVWPMKGHGWDSEDISAALAITAKEEG
jgi:hypothetical protein